MDYRIESAQIAIYFEKYQEMRRRIFDLEAVLGDRFVKPFNLLQVPDEAPPEIPRIQAKTKNGHSQLLVSTSNATLQTKFDGGWENDWSKCSEYLKNNTESLYHVLYKMEIDPVLYFGLVVNVFFPFADANGAVEHISRHFLKNPTVNLQDINLKLVKVVDGKYYQNFAISNRINYKVQGFVPRQVPAYLKAADFGLLLNIDLNDRYAYNNTREYQSERADKVVFEQMDNIMKNSIHRLIENGEY